MLWIIPAIAALTAGTASTPGFLEQAQWNAAAEAPVVAVNTEQPSYLDEYEVNQIGW